LLLPSHTHRKTARVSDPAGQGCAGCGSQAGEPGAFKLLFSEAEHHSLPGGFLV
jgi:hypothetical protein